MTLTAIVVAGVPATISGELSRRLKGRYSDGYVVRVNGAPSYNDKYTRYAKKQIEGVLSAAVDAIFGRTKRPIGFCRNAARGCTLSKPGKSGCVGSEHLACSLHRPQAFFLIYQEGYESAELLKAFHYSPLVANIPVSAYGNNDATFTQVVTAVEKLKRHILDVSASLESHNSALYLPPLNFKKGSGDMLLRTMTCEASTAAAKAFRKQHFDRVGSSYVGRNRLLFSPADVEIQHGDAGPVQRDDLAISRVFRLGVYYRPGIHYDVSRDDGRNFSREVEFICRSNGKFRPQGKYTNLLVDDCAR